MDVCRKDQGRNAGYVSLKSKPSQSFFFPEAKKPYAEVVGQTGAQGLVRGFGPHCLADPRIDPARAETSEAPRAGRGSASFSGLMSGVRNNNSGALSCSLRGAARVQGGGNPISIDQRPKPRKEG